MSPIPSTIKKKHIEKAIHHIDINGIPKPKRRRTDYFLCYNAGKRKLYQPKYVLSIANKFANGEELDFDKFDGGENETHAYLRNYDFVVASADSKMLLEAYVNIVIEEKGKGHIVSSQEIKDKIQELYGRNPKTIDPSDYCYNRWDKNNPVDRPLFFEDLGENQYRVWGNNASYCGEIIYPDDLPDDSPEYREGKKKSILVNTYERNPAARQSCIAHYGTRCFVCKFDFGEKYGKECNGMIHVHHLKPISETDSEYVVDPINDLRPVWPNCHMVLHSKKGYTIEEVQAMVNHSDGTARRAVSP